MAVGDIVPAVVVAVGKPAPAGGARLRIGRYHADLTRDGFAWTRRATAADLVKPGDLIEVRITKLDEAIAARCRSSSSRRRSSKGALVAIENRTGHIKAMVGGWTSRAASSTGPSRPTGSSARPSSRSSTRRPSTAASRRRRSSWTRRSAIPSGNGEAYEPQNYDHKFEGAITLRRALEDSRNIPAIKMMETLGPASGPRVRQALRLLGGLPALPADRARRRRRDAARGHERIHGLPEQGRADDAARRPEGDGPRAATCSRRTAPSRSTSSAPTRRS